MADEQVPKVEDKEEKKELGNRIQISSQRPLPFYVNLAKRYMNDNDEIELSGLGNAINSTVSVAEVLKSSEVGVIKKIFTSTVPPSGEGIHAPVDKAKIQIWISRGPKFEYEEETPTPQ